jgi:NADPH-dependent 2,4-dienoyl-CoA reductase/sulfur reductase-like enzyme
MKIVIVGNGVAGISCALVARQREPEAEITVVSGETDFFFSRTALMYAYMDMMPRQNLEPYERGAYARQRIQLVRDWVVDLDAGARRLTLERGGSLAYDRLVFAVGASPNMFGWEGADQIKEGKVHFVSMQDLDACERLTPSTREAVVVGGGLIGIELVESLLHHKVKTSFLIREPYYWPVALGQEEADFVAAHLRAHGVDLRLGDEMQRIEVDARGRVSGVVTKQGASLPCQLLGIAVGVKPNVERLKKFKDCPQLGRGIVVNEQLETSLPGVFACGDCAEIHPEGGRPYGELIWYSAKRQGELVGRNLFGDGVRYKPPTFFNSSKFFEIEYTTVGEVMSLPDGTPTLYGKMPGKDISVRIVHDGEKVLGFNLLGSRWNHEILERWVEERRSPEFVRSRLRAAQYDVEFGRAALEKIELRELPLKKVM